MSCGCNSCGKQYKVDFIVTDELWEKIKPAGKATGAGMLCGSCIATEIENIGAHGMFNISGVSTDRIKKNKQSINL